MDQILLREREGLCTQENPPRCTAECPLHVDVKGIVRAIQKKDYKGAYKLYSRSVPFPNILSHICEAPCMHKCLRNELDESILIGELEKYIVLNGRPSGPSKILLPPEKQQSVAVVGAGLSGLTVAKILRLKGYKVTVFEKSKSLGGRLNQYKEEVLPAALRDKAFENLKKMGIEINLEHAIGVQGNLSLEALRERYTAVYIDVATAELDAVVGEQAKPLMIDPLTYEIIEGGVFAGGSLCGDREAYLPVRSISDGKRAANSIDRYFQRVSLTANRVGEGCVETQLFTNIEDETIVQAIYPSDSIKGYTQEEAEAEAERCLLCECLECVKACEYMKHYKGYPKRYFREVYNNLSIVMGIHHANKMINTCSQCGQCAQICPNGADMGLVCKEARNQMVEKGKMPPSAHDFALRDMAFSVSDHFAMMKKPPHQTEIKTLFFPGCQLSASAPEHVEKIYPWLCENLSGGTGLMLDCCGAPALWAGRKDLFDERMTHIKETWLAEDKPKIITACPSCFSVFKEHLPEIEVEMLYTLLDQKNFVGMSGQGIEPQRLAVHDSCSTRLERGLQESVRNLLKRAGHEIVELKYSKDKTTCCGYGGLMMFANREVAKAVIEARVNECSEDYVVYCAMCRDNFTGQNKRTYHLLDLLFAEKSTSYPVAKGPDFSERHENRSRLKRTLLKTIWGECQEEVESKVNLIIKDDVRAIMAERNILIEDLTKVLEHVEETGQKMWNATKETYVAYYRPVSVTYWVEFTRSDEGYHILNTYSHRLEIEV
ncbi:pyridine nucleotide-disulfide oxidoreductase/dicluster-binding protein [Fusibacter ferrireducens]|uniref:NAD(P)-binding protein n=1 Tax=Fusibacter ferrireducens TaxID=2785058 RepID=A0ABR9ZUB9_9FIRM|nr:pyridine nucleotide-disulfide oxidoreductase/dicluster-binding protein [Fusibacter ferrireducens]MBF4694064.1 NAD(P)-binding protein [Fusibacter ferrireducens]